MPRNREKCWIFGRFFGSEFDGFFVKIIYKITTFWITREQIHRPPRAPSIWRLPGRGIAAFFTPKGHENRNFRRKNDSCPTSDNLLFGVFSSFLRVFSPVGTPRICKKVPFSGRNHTRRKDVKLQKTTIILPFFVPPDDESSLVGELRIWSLLLVEELLF